MKVWFNPMFALVNHLTIIMNKKNLISLLDDKCVIVTVQKKIIRRMELSKI